jgi:Fur family ferric uptake transcriptional regulator
MSEQLLELLNGAGVRLTGPRRELAALISKRGGHFTAADLVADAAKRRLGIGRATVFRFLDLLTEQGVMEHVDLPDGRHAYVPCEPTHHHHLVCRGCGAAVEVSGREVEAWAADVAAAHGFSEVSHTIELFGTCSQCRG